MDEKTKPDASETSNLADGDGAGDKILHSEMLDMKLAREISVNLQSAEMKPDTSTPTVTVLIPEIDDQAGAYYGFEDECRKLKIELMEDKELPTWRDCCIYRVPKILRDIEPKVYTPKLISIGPFHRRNINIQGVTRDDDDDQEQSPLPTREMVKLNYLEAFYKRIARNVSLEELMNIVKQRETRIRHCYENSKSKVNDADGDEFAKIILVDSVFIIELFLREYEGVNQYSHDLILSKPWRRTTAQQDLILLENQLPFFILDDLYNNAFANASGKCPSFLDLTVSYFRYYINKPMNYSDCEGMCECDCCSLLYCFWLTDCSFCRRCCCWSQKSQNHHQEEMSKSSQQPFIPLHFTDLIRWYRSHKHPNPPSKNQESTPQHCIDLASFSCCQSRRSKKDEKYIFPATKLHEAGVIFKACEKEWPLGITFENGVLTIPCFSIFDDTERIFRNLMAFEQCHYPNEAYICDYISLLDFLIDSEKDVDLLVEKGIIMNWLGSSKMVAEMVNNLNKEILAGNYFCYQTIREQLNYHYGNRWYRTVANLRHVYFPNVWRGSGTVAAFTVLIFTSIQTIRSLQEMF